MSRREPLENVTLWSEGNVLIPRRVDPISGEPDYNAWVKIEKIK